MNWTMFFPVFAAVLVVGWAEERMVGAPVAVDVNNGDVQNALMFAVKEHNKASNNMYLTGVAEVIKVTRQVVSGMKYIITVKMARTPCRKSSLEQVCAVHEDPEKALPYQCTFTVWSIPWQRKITLLDEKCDL